MFLGIPVILYVIAATWRLVNLIVNEDGPHYMFARMRKNASRSRARWVRRFGLVQLLNCEYCMSIWIGGIFALGYRLLGDVFLWIALPLVLSTGTIIIKHIVFLIKSADARLDQLNTLPKPSTPERIHLDRPIWDTLFREQISEKGGD